MADLDWTLPVMRAGYAGRGLTYVAVAGISLYAISRGGEAQGTSSVMESLSGSPWGLTVLALIALGLLAYMVWRLIDAALDLEDYGTDAKGLVARTGMVATGIIHGVLGGLAAAIALGLGSGGGGESGGGESGGGESGSGGSGFAGLVQTVLEWPAGWIIVTIAGLVTIGAGVYYGVKGIRASYRKHLRSNPFTTRFDMILRAGVVAQGVVILLVGGFLVRAGWTQQSGGSGGVGQAFDFLQAQPFGRVLVVAICLGLAGFAFFCFVNAAYRAIPRLSDDGKLETLAASMKDGAKRAAS